MAYIYRYDNGRFEQFDRPVVREQPLTIFVNGVEMATFLHARKTRLSDGGILAFEVSFTAWTRFVSWTSMPRLGLWTWY